MADARPTTPQQQEFVRQLMALVDPYQDAPSPEAGLALLDRLIDLLPQAQNLEQLKFVLMAASTAATSRPHVPFLMAVMERLVALLCPAEASSGEFQRAVDLKVVLREMVPALNRCSACEQMIVVCAYIQACAALVRAQGMACLSGLQVTLRQLEGLVLETGVWVELAAAIDRCSRGAGPVLNRPVPSADRAREVVDAQEPVVVFDLLKLPLELQSLVIASLPHPYDAQTREEWQAIGRVIDALSRVNKAFHADMRPMLFAKGLHALRQASGPMVLAALHDPELSLKLRAVTQHPLGPSSAGQCLADLAHAAVGIRHPMHAVAVWQCLIDLVKQELRDPSAPGVPYAILPTLLMAHSPLWDEGIPPLSSYLCFKVLVQNLGDLPEEAALPALLEAALRALQHGLSHAGGAVSISTPSGSWRDLRASEVLAALEELGYPVPAMALHLNALAAVLVAGETLGGGTLDAPTVMAALGFLRDCPYPLVGSLAKALKTIQRHHINPDNEELVAECAKKLCWSELALQGDEPAGVDPAVLAALFPNHHIHVQQGVVHLRPKPPQ